ncbi:MAG TPA: hypothetical protein VK072_02070 [Candidatus Avamphibacillus sp.]|nr:hypothetical protein [Candidatus Avamphibacillus sp.]
MFSYFQTPTPYGVVIVFLLLILFIFRGIKIRKPSKTPRLDTMEMILFIALMIVALIGVTNSMLL